MVSFEQYRTAVASFLEISERLNDGWTRFHTGEASDDLMSIRKRQTILCQHQTFDNCPSREISEADDKETEDEIFDDQKDLAMPSGILISEYHIIYNEAFAVPQLLFNAFRTDGSLVKLSLLHDLIPRHLVSQSPDTDREAVWSTLSQIEHPILHCPIYALHPCQTENFIQKIRNFSEQWFLSWLSSVGPAVGLRLDPQYGFTPANTLDSYL